jgi:hypothetical protein
VLSLRDQQENYLFRGGDLDHDKDDPFELLQRVSSGLKPVANIVLVNLSRRQREQVMKQCGALSLHGRILVNRWGVKCLLLCKPEATLNDYWSYDGVYQKYAAARVTPPGRHCFLEPISSTLADLNNECLSYPEIGLLYGYPVDETIALLTVG